MKQYPRSDHYNGKTFFNPGTNTDKNLFDLLKWSVNRVNANYPKWVENTKMPQLPYTVETGKIALTFVNHVTFLYQTKNFNFLTDPLWAERTSPISFLGPKRVRPPGIKIEALPHIHFVLVSHNHYDHMDIETLKVLQKKFNPVFIMPLGNSGYLPGINAVELDWWESTMVGDAKITLVPAQHWSARNFWDRKKALWGGFIVECDLQKIYFSGDTGFSEKIFQDIAQAFPQLDTALLPIGAYEPRWFMKEHHMNPEEAVLAHQILQAKRSVGMHFGTFCLTDEMWGQPENDLKTAIQKHSVDNFELLDVGETKIF